MRLDNSDQVVREYFNIPLFAEPGTVDPIDLCRYCAVSVEDEMRGLGIGHRFCTIDHPPYADDVYRCYICTEKLNEEDEGE